MSEHDPISRSHEQWARFRFSVVGPLLAAPPERGQLQAHLEGLAAKKWRHPISGHWVQFGLSTIERWYYTALNEKQDPVTALRRKHRSDSGQHPALSPKLRELLAAQHRQHPSWSYQLQADNLAVLVEQQPELGPKPAYASVRALHESPRAFQAAAPGSRAQSRRAGRRAAFPEPRGAQL